jgi:hypothetical protein
LQLELKGMVAIGAYSEKDLVGAVLWYCFGGVAYYHLAAYSGRGYELKSSFPIFYESLKYLRKRVAFAALGGGAGIQPGEEDGLSRFKQGWSTESRNVYFCGKILNKEKYQSRCISSGLKNNVEFFPAYRSRFVLDH